MDYLIKELEPTLAKKRFRYLATLIDYLLYVVVFIIVSYYFGEKYTTEEGGTGWHVDGWPAWLIFLSWFMLLPVAEGLTQQTIGKMLFGIKVIKVDYSKASMGTCLIRHLFDIVDYMPFLGMIGMIVSKNSEKSQRVGYLVAKTIVVLNEKKIS